MKLIAIITTMLAAFGIGVIGIPVIVKIIGCFILGWWLFMWIDILEDLP